MCEYLTKRIVFLQLIALLENKNIPYCVLAGYERYPEVISSDVDFMVEQEQLACLPTLMQEIARETGSSFVQFLQHETSACYFVLANQDGSKVSFLHPDACSNYRRKGKLWISARDLLARRRRHAKGFYIPAADDAFTYYLIKKIDKGSISEAQGNHLSALFAEDPAGCEKRLHDFWLPQTAELIMAAATDNDWGNVRGELKRLAKELHANSPRESMMCRARQWLRETSRRICRVWKPTGLFLVFLGPDGAGKSTVIERVERELAPAFRRTKIFHLMPRLGRRSVNGTDATNPHAKSTRGFVTSLVKLFYYWLDYTFGYWLEIRPRLVRSTFVIFDRYYHDVLVDPRRYRYGAPLWLARLVGMIIPKPDLWILLDAQPEIFQLRKQEVSLEETSRQRDAYLQLIRSMPNGYIVDASQLPAKVAADAERLIIEHMTQRVANRLNNVLE